MLLRNQTIAPEPCGCRTTSSSCSARSGRSPAFQSRSDNHEKSPTEKTLFQIGNQFWDIRARPVQTSTLPLRLANLSTTLTVKQCPADFLCSFPVLFSLHRPSSTFIAQMASLLNSETTDLTINVSEHKKSRVVVIGAGLVGKDVICALQDEAEIDLTVIDRRNYYENNMGAPRAIVKPEFHTSISRPHGEWIKHRSRLIVGEGLSRSLDCTDAFFFLKPRLFLSVVCMHICAYSCRLEGEPSCGVNSRK